MESSGDAIVDIGYAWGLDNAFKGTVKLSRICPFCGRILLNLTVPPIAITPVLRRQFNHRSGQLILVGPIHRLIPLCPSPLPQQPAAMPFRYSILLPCTPYRTTPPLRA